MAISKHKLRAINDKGLAWPHNLTLGQMLHQCGYLMSAIIQHDDTPEAVIVAIAKALKEIRVEVEASDPSNVVIASIEAFHLFAPMAQSLVRTKKAA